VVKGKDIAIVENGKMPSISKVPIDRRHLGHVYACLPKVACDKVVLQFLVLHTVPSIESITARLRAQTACYSPSVESLWHVIQLSLKY
jgi:hypothetical protein